MKARRVGPAIVLLAVIALLAWWLVQDFERRDASLPDAPSRSAMAGELAPDRFEVEAAAPSAPEPPRAAQLVDAPAERPAVTPAPDGVAIIVVDEASTPVPGALVQTWAEDDDDWQDGLPPLAILETDATGRCAVPYPGDQGVLVASREGLGSTGYVHVSTLRRQVTLSGEAVVRLVASRSRVRGLVVEADDRPAAGVSVEFWPFGGPGGGRIPRPVQTDAEGRFEISAGAGAMLGLQAIDGERRSNEVRFITEPHGEREVLLRMPGDWTIGGIVFSRRSEPLANVKVMLWRVIPEWFLPPEERPDVMPNSWHDEQATGADGRFLFRVRERLAYTVIAMIPGELPTPAADVVIDAAHDHAFVELRPPEPSFIAGRVVDPAGAAVPDVTVRALTSTVTVPSDRFYAPWPKDLWGEGGAGRTDAQGAFRIEGLHPDGYYRVGLPGTIRDLRRPDPATDVHAGRTDVLLVQDGLGGTKMSVTFTVSSMSEGSLIPGANISVYRLTEEGGWWAGLPSEPLPDGRVSFGKFASGQRYAALVEADGFAAVDVPEWVAGPDVTEIQVLLPRPASLDVVVLHANGDPVAWADASVAQLVERLQGIRSWRRDADSAGRASFSGVDPGPLRVTVRAGGRVVNQDIELGDGEARQMRVVLPD